MSDIPIIDHQCRRCLNPYCGGTDFYYLRAKCLNCGDVHICRISKGHTPSGLWECPTCGVSRLHYGTSAEARAIMEQLQLDYTP